MTGRQDLFDESMRLGHSAAWDLQWEKAIEYYRKALAEYTDNPSALTSLGLALLETGRLQEALSIYRRAMKADPEDPIPVEKTAEILERLGQPTEAIERRDQAADMYIRRRDAEKAVENWNHIARLAPTNLAVRSRLALTYERLGRRTEAVTEYLAVSAILQSAGKIDRALEASRRALSLAPGNQLANETMRMLREGQPLPPPPPPRGSTAPLRMAQVKEYLKSETVESPEDGRGELADPEIAAQRQALTILAGLLFEEPDNDEEDASGSQGITAITQGRHKRLQTPSGQPRFYRHLGEAIDLQTRGHKRQAIKVFKKAMDEGLDHPAAHYNLGLLHKDLYDYAIARKHLMASLGHPELALGANLTLGRLSRLEDDMAEAARYLLQALRLADSLSVDSNQSSQLNQLYDTILASQKEGDTESLSRIVESTLNFLSGPEWLERVKQARQQLEGQGEGTSIVPIAEMLAVGGSNRVVQAINRINELATDGHYSSAMEEAMLAIDYAPTYVGLHMAMAEILIKTNRPEVGFRKLATIAETHRIRGESQKAAAVYARLVRHSPVDVSARMRLIDLLAQQDRTDEALGQCLELAELYRQMAEIDAARRTLGEALRLAQRASVDRFWSSKILHQMGDIDLSRLDWRRALRVYQQLGTIDPRDDVARFHIIDLNLRLGQEEQAAKELDSYLEQLVQSSRGSEALNLLEDMTREHPGTKALHSRLAEAYKAAGRTADAIAQLDALGDIQLNAGEVQEAIRTIRMIVNMGPPDVEGYRQLLRNLEAGL